MLIYKFTNKINGKIYVGKTKKSLRQRITAHKSAAKTFRGNQLIHKAIRKYGIENFEIVILEDKIASINELNERERHYIALNRSTEREFGYNFSIGGEGGTSLSGSDNPMFGKSRPDLSARNIVNKGKTLEEIHGKEKAEEIKRMASQSSSGKKHSDESKRKMGESQKLSWERGRNNSEKYFTHMQNRLNNAILVMQVKVFCPELNMEFDSVTAAAKYTNNSIGNVSSVLNGKLKRTKGYTFVRIG